jgi:ubiquinone/menaquinone biosynthesis C-methylase UbiE
MKYTGERSFIDQLNEDTIEHLHRYAFAKEFVKNKIVVDIASGEGYGAHILSTDASQVTGIDVSSEAIKHANNKYKKNNLIYIQGAADTIPLENDSVDIVTSFETLEHHDKHEEMIQEIIRILKADGILILSTPDKLNYTDIPQNINKFHVKELYEQEFIDLIQGHFEHTHFLKQKMSFSSFITQIEPSVFYEFQGNAQKIVSNQGINSQLYNITVASNVQLPDTFSSSFDGNEIIKYLKGQLDKANEKYIKKITYIDSIERSTVYKLLHFFRSPFKFFK